MATYQSPSSLDNLPGDKVRIRSGVYAKQRGVICAVSDEDMTIEIAPDILVRLSHDGVTNYSLAARRAWGKMPKRAGRPKSRERRKRMVSLRIDQEIWERLGRAVDQGLIPNREQAINAWLHDQLDRLEQAHGVTVLSVAPDDES